MRFLLRILVFTALICGGMLYYFWDLPIVQQFVPSAKKAKPEETVHIYALRLVDLAIQEKQPTDYGSMQKYYLQAVKGKYQALTNHGEKLNLTDFLAAEKTARVAVWLRKLDTNLNTKVEQSEWENDFSFVSHDINEDGSIDSNEYWQSIAKDIGEEFIENDLDSDSNLSLAEYVKLKGGDKEAEKFAHDFDLDRNNHISNAELNGAKHRYGYY